VTHIAQATTNVILERVTVTEILIAKLVLSVVKEAALKTSLVLLDTRNSKAKEERWETKIKMETLTIAMILNTTKKPLNLIQIGSILPQLK
jgi:hypothetical protein